MRLHYRFIHACGHTGNGPLISDNLEGSSQHLSLPGNEKLTTIQLELPFSCPFCSTSACSSTSTFPEVPLGHGILTILSPSYPSSWCIIRSCKHEEVTEADWAHSTSENGGFRQMAWIPKPCGEVRVTDRLAEMRSEGRVQARVITDVACTWRQRVDDPVENRFAGLLSQWNAAVSYRTRAGR
jgi:hypothetical protein